MIPKGDNDLLTLDVEIFPACGRLFFKIVGDIMQQPLQFGIGYQRRVGQRSLRTFEDFLVTVFTYKWKFRKPIGDIFHLGQC